MDSTPWSTKSIPFVSTQLAMTEAENLQENRAVKAWRQLMPQRTEPESIEVIKLTRQLDRSLGLLLFHEDQLWEGDFKGTRRLK